MVQNVCGYCQSASTNMLKKQNVHLMLHLVECMEQFGPTSSFCNRERYDDHNKLLGDQKRMQKLYTKNCRCESFNSFIRVQNIYGTNKRAL